VNENPVFRVLHRTLDVVENAGIEYAVMGGFAVGHWGLPRPTYDVDVAIAVDRDVLVELLDAYEEDGFSVDEAFRSGFADTLAGMRKVGLGLFDEGSVWRVDLFLATTDFVRSAVARRTTTEMDGRRVSVVSAEDLLLFKLLANRAKDRADIEDLLLVCGELDRAYRRIVARVRARAHHHGSSTSPRATREIRKAPRPRRPGKGARRPPGWRHAEDRLWELLRSARTAAPAASPCRARAVGPRRTPR